MTDIATSPAATTPDHGVALTEAAGSAEGVTATRPSARIFSATSWPERTQSPTETPPR